MLSSNLQTVNKQHSDIIRAVGGWYGTDIYASDLRSVSKLLTILGLSCQGRIWSVSMLMMRGLAGYEPQVSCQFDADTPDHSVVLPIRCRARQTTQSARRDLEGFANCCCCQALIVSQLALTRRSDLQGKMDAAVQNPTPKGVCT